MCMKSLTKLLPKGFQRITGSHRHADTRQLLSLFMFFPATRIKPRNLKTLVIDNYFPLYINKGISVWFMTALEIKRSHIWHLISKATITC